MFSHPKEEDAEDEMMLAELYRTETNTFNRINKQVHNLLAQQYFLASALHKPIPPQQEGEGISHRWLPRAAAAKIRQSEWGSEGVREREGGNKGPS